MEQINKQDEVFLNIYSQIDFGKKLALSLLYNKEFPALTHTCIEALNDIYFKETYGKKGKLKIQSNEMLDNIINQIKATLTEQGIAFKEADSDIEKSLHEESEFYSPSKEHNVLYHFTDKQYNMNLKDISLENTSFKKEEALIPILLILSPIKGNLIREFFHSRNFETKSDLFKNVKNNVSDCGNILNEIKWDTFNSKFNSFFLRKDIEHESMILSAEDAFLPQALELSWHELLIREIVFRTWIADETLLTEFLYLRRLNQNLDSKKIQKEILKLENKLLSKMEILTNKTVEQFKLFSVTMRQYVDDMKNEG